MPLRLPACDPCRFSKLSCDHLQPCSRCRDRRQTSQCKYRSRPFKKSRKGTPTVGSQSPGNEIDGNDLSMITVSLAENIIKTHRRYPNPGYLGSSSHTTLFEHLPRPDVASIGDDVTKFSHRRSSDTTTSDGAHFITCLRGAPHIVEWKQLVEGWTSRGVNLALAGPLVKPCVSSFGRFLQDIHSSTCVAQEEAKKLASSTSRPMLADFDCTLEQFQFHLNEADARWETLGLFFTAVARAALDNRGYPLGPSSDQRREIGRTAMEYSDRCVNLALSLDCLNDLQLLLQYENMILHSTADGDQSYHTWKKLGGVISTLFALGYHEQINDKTIAPRFLKDLRRAALARTYSADKNVSIFLGRPPRMLQEYCNLGLPRYSIVDSDANDAALGSDHFVWASDEEFEYIADTKWSALCATLKEEILHLMRRRNIDEKAENARSIRTKAESQWIALPPQFRQSDNHDCPRGSSQLQDFMSSARLNHLHVLLLLELAIDQRADQPGHMSITLAAEMLDLVVLSIIHKERLVNSGTSLGWRVTYYGLTAAGVICLALLNQRLVMAVNTVSRSQVIQNLSVLVAELSAGSIVPRTEPNYVLLVSAARTMRALLDRVLSNDAPQVATNQDMAAVESPIGNNANSMDWLTWEYNTAQDFDIEFWQSLVDHPFIFGSTT
ncbi:putative Zn(II)2Cys6 transcription factor [Xylariaceae sp. FL0255]|nr:putative Zn(II)2Cys6 transcription factor [Xylariaceae sp. FL0255]